MRVFLATTVATACACATALLPLAFPAPAPAAARIPSVSDVHGANRSIALTPLAGDDTARARDAVAPEGLGPRTVQPFSMLGVTWSDGDAALRGDIQVRTRSAVTGAWSDWQDLAPSDDRPDRGSAEETSGVRGGTAPLWVGDSDGVQVRVTPDSAIDRVAGTRAPTLPQGLRVDLVDPGATRAPDGPGGNPDTAGPETSAATRAATHDATQDQPGGDSGVDRRAGRFDLSDGWNDGGQDDGYPDDDSYNYPSAHRAPRPAIVTRAGWDADESLRESGFSYTDSVKAVFVHHTATSNDYQCDESASIVRGIYRYHVLSEGWRDIGYNFLIDKCGTIYEGRAGGAARAVQGAHTLGFNEDTSGIALIGTFSRDKPSAAAVRSLERLSAWKLGLTGVSATGRTTLISAGSNKYPYGDRVTLNTISGHRDGFTTDCPGDRLYDQLPAIRRAAAALQHR